MLKRPSSFVLITVLVIVVVAAAIHYFGGPILDTLKSLHGGRGH